MSDAKISDLPSSTGVTPASDYIPIVHNGTTEKITPNELIGGLGLATDAELAAGLATKADVLNPVPSYPTTASIPAPYTGVARVGTNLYVGDGVNLSKEVSSVYLSASNTASQNTAAIQAALNLAGDVYVVGSGVRLINATLIIKSNTKLTLSSDLTLKLADASNCNMLRNTAWGSTAKTVTAISITNPTIGGSPAVLATASITAHGKNVGDFVFIHGVTPDLYNGIWEVYSKTTDTLSYIMAYDVGDAIASGAGTKHPYIPPSAATDINGINGFANTYNLTATLSSTTVTSSPASFPSGANGAAWVGKTLQVRTGAGVVTELGVIASVTTSGSLQLVSGSTAAFTGKFNLLNPTGMFMRDADVNISITGGEWDYNGYGQTIGSTYLNHALYLRKVGFLSLYDLKLSNVTKYAASLANIYHGSAKNISLDTNSDGIHWMGSGDYLQTDGIYGRAGDDFTVVGQGEFWFHADSEYVMGDFGSVIITNIKLRTAFSGFKFYGCGQYTIKDLRIDNIGGTFSGGYGLVLIINDTVCPGSEGGWANAKTIQVSAQWDQNSTKNGIQIANAIIDELNIPNLVMGLGNTSGTSNGIIIANTSYVKHLTAGNLRFYASSGAFSTNALGLFIDGTSVLARASISAIACDNMSSAISSTNTTISDNQCIYDIGSIKGYYLDCAMYSAGRINLNVGIATRFQYTNSDKFFQFGDHSKLTVGRGYNLTGSCVSLTAGKSLVINAPDVGVDITVGTGAGAGVYGITNTSFLYTGTGIGTLETNNTVNWRPATSKWVQCTDTTKTS